MDLEEICKIYFDDQVKPKHLKEFAVDTPEGNHIQGYINKKPNKYLGSMYIFKLNGVPTSQFVYSMPKIHYLDNDYRLADDDSYREYIAYEKLDGSCLIVYPLLLNGDVIEIVPKSRNTPVVDKFLFKMYQLIDKSRLFLFFRENRNTTLLFELFGVMNKHDIFYPKTYIDIRLIGATRESEILLDKDLDRLAEEYDFKRPVSVFKLIHYQGKWRYYIMCDSSDLFYYMPELEVVYYPTQKDCIDAMIDTMQVLNDNYYKEHGRKMIEGCVINGICQDGVRQLYIKVKPWDILEDCKFTNGIPRKFILKEARKYFDEYGSQVKEIYSNDKTHFEQYISKNLCEEFDEKYVYAKSTQRKIETVFFDLWKSLTPSASIQNVCHELVDKYPKLDLPDLMRKFAAEYPQFKKDARLVYSVLKKVVRKYE